MHRHLTIKSFDGYDIPLLCESSRRTQRVVVAVHGLFTDKHEHGRFDRLANLLVDELDVVRFDYRCHGDFRPHNVHFTISCAVADFCSVLTWCRLVGGYEDIAVVASSFGASVVLSSVLLGDVSDQIRNLVLLSPLIDYSILFPTSSSPSDIAFSDQDIASVSETGGITLPNGFYISKELVAEFHTYTPYMSFERLHCPTLILHGEKDERVPLSSVRSKTQFPNITLEVFPDVGHALKPPHIEGRVHAAIRDWIRL